MHLSLYQAEQQRSGSYSHWYKSEENFLKLIECNIQSSRGWLIQAWFGGDHLLRHLFDVQWQPWRLLTDRRIHNHQLHEQPQGWSFIPKLGISPESTFLCTQKSHEMQRLFMSLEKLKLGLSGENIENPFLLSTKRPSSLLGDPCPGCCQPSVLSRRVTELESTGLMGTYRNCGKD